MPQFTHYTKEDGIPPVPEGWLFVAYYGTSNKIVDNAGNSMPPRGRALVDGSDSAVVALVADGVLKVLSEATVSIENYAEPVIVKSDGTKEKLAMLQQVIASRGNDFSEEISEPVEATAEMLAIKAEKEEAAKKPRKKKYVDVDASNTSNEIELDIVESVTDETMPDTSTSNEEPTV